MPVDTLTCGGARYHPRRVFCIGKNYSEHIRELREEAPGEPVVFMKPATALVPPGETLVRPTHGGELHHEAELVVLIGGEGHRLSVKQAPPLIAGLSLGLDLTLRDLQHSLKSRGLPWERSKAFDQSAPLGDFTPCSPALDPDAIRFECRVNGQVKQQGDTRHMLYPVAELIAWLSVPWRLMPGDLVFTGTPSGAGPLPPRARVTLDSPQLGCWEWFIE